MDHALDAEAFLRQQEHFIKESHGLVEESRIDSVVQEGPLDASAVVHWRLREGERVSTGIDRFTIIRTDESAWKIISLTYYETDFRAPPNGGFAGQFFSSWTRRSDFRNSTWKR